MDVLHLIDRLEEIVAEARRLPIGGGAVVNRQQLLDLVDRMRVAVPREVYDAREVIDERDEVLRQGELQAAEVLAQAHEELERRLGETEIVQAAHDKARVIMAEAEERVRDLLRSAEEQARDRLDEAQTTANTEMREADAYALQTLRKLEGQLESFISTVRNGVDALEARSSDRPRS
jgi:cell division septum initiation protein DivIVA